MMHGGVVKLSYVAAQDAFLQVDRCMPLKDYFKCNSAVQTL